MRRIALRPLFGALFLTLVCLLLMPPAATATSALPEDLQSLEIQDHYIPSDLREVGVLHGLNGRVVVVHRAKGEAFFGKPGDRIHENDELNTLEGSRCRIRFYSDDVVNMAPETRFAVEAFEDRRGEGKKSSLFSMVKGKAMFYALRLFRYRDTRFKVKTPTAIVGVRGTKFGLDVFWFEEGETAHGGGIQVADRGRGLDAFLAQNQGRGLRSGTRAACGDGSLGITDPVTGQPVAEVNPNEVFNSATGDKTLDPNNETLNGIQQASHVRAEGEGEEEAPTQPAVEGDDQVGEGTGLPDTTFLTDDQTNITQQQTGEGTQEEGAGPSFTPFEGTPCCPLMGYFSALLLYKSSTPGEIREAFTSRQLQQLDPLNDAYAYGVPNFSNFIWADENAYGDDVGDVTLAPEGTSNLLDLEGKTRYLGQYDYLQWGYAMADSTLLPVCGSVTFELLNKLWFVEGYPTSPTELAAMSGDYTYTGGVNGTYYSMSEQVDIKGTYSSDVHFGSSEVRSFVLNASGGGHTVDYSWSGNASISANGEFEISGLGTFNIDGSPAVNRRVNGAHFGTGAKEQGGSFAGYCPSSDCGAYGVFYGRR